MITIDNVLVHLGPAVHIIRLDGEHFLQRIRCTVSLKGPHFHLTEALTTELRLTTQRLLSYQAVRTGRTGVHLVIDQVVKLKDIHIPHSHRTIEGVPGATIVQLGLTGCAQPGQLKHMLDFGLFGTVEHWRGHRNTAAQVVTHLLDFLVVQGIQVHLEHFVRVVIDLIK
jgi:hypothetical protein